MPRNRLEELRAASKHAPVTEEEELRSLTKQQKSVVEPLAGTGDDFKNFLAHMEEVVESVGQVEKNTVELRTLYRTILDSARPDHQAEARVNDLMAENKKLARTISNILKDEQTWCERNDPSSLPKSKKVSPHAKREWNMRKTQTSAQSRRFYDVWDVYNRNQMDYHEKTKKSLITKLKITNVALTEDEIEEKIKEGDTAIFGKSILDKELVARQQLTTELQDRHEEFLKLEKSLTEVRDMFFEVATLVEQQGEMLNRIEDNIAHAQVDVESGRQDLQKAEISKAGARKKKICLAAVLAVIVLIIVMVILSEFGAFSGSSGGETIVKSIVIHHDSPPNSSTSTTTQSTTDLPKGTIAP